MGAGDSAPRTNVFGKGCLVLILALMGMAILLGPFPLHNESNWDALVRANWPREAIFREFVAERLKRQKIDGRRAEELIKVNPGCCSIEAIHYNPGNWLGWHLLAGFKGSPAWLVEAEYTYRRGNAYFRYRTFGRLTNGGGYVSEYSEGPGRLVAVERANGCEIDRLGSGLEMLRSEYRPVAVDRASDEPAKPLLYTSQRARSPCTDPAGEVMFLSTRQQKDLEDIVAILHGECDAEVSAKKREQFCGDLPAVLSSVNEGSLDRSESLAAQLRSRP